MANLTLEQLEDILGLPIVLLTAWNPTTNKWDDFKVRDLPLTGIASVIKWLNEHRQ